MASPTRHGSLSLIACLSLLLAAAHLQAAACYVAVSGNDTNDGSSPEKAWKTVTHAAKKAAAGDTVYIKAGLYRERGVVLQNSGTEKAPIVFQGYKDKPGDTPDPKYKPGDKQVKDAVHSPCIDAGDPKDDFAGEPKPDGGRIDIGAYGGINDAPAEDNESGANGATSSAAAAKAPSISAKPKASEEAVKAWTERLRARVKISSVTFRGPSGTFEIVGGGAR